MATCCYLTVIVCVCVFVCLNVFSIVRRKPFLAVCGPSPPRGPAHSLNLRGARINLTWRWIVGNPRCALAVLGWLTVALCFAGGSGARGDISPLRI